MPDIKSLTAYATFNNYLIPLYAANENYKIIGSTFYNLDTVVRAVKLSGTEKEKRTFSLCQSTTP